MAFASTTDYRAVYDTTLDDGRLQSMLDRSSRMIARACDDAGVSTDEPVEEFSEALSDVCIEMVHRSDPGASGAVTDVPLGATQFSIGADGFSQSFSMGNPYGDLFITKAEREYLGIADDGSVGAIWPLMQEDREAADA